MDADGRCQACRATPGLGELILGTQREQAPGGEKQDLVSQALSVPHRLFDPVPREREGLAARG